MATAAILNGDASTAIDDSPATAPEQVHKVEHIRKPSRPTVEDVPDEEDLAHPPPSTTQSENQHAKAEGTSAPLSEKAAGKQRVLDELTPAEANAKKTPAVPVVPDTRSEEAFPALGGGPKPKSSGVAPVMWGAKKVAGGKNGTNGLTNGHSVPASLGSSRASTPAPGMRTPVQTQLDFPHTMNLPGKHVERIQFAPSQLLKKDQLKKPVLDILRDINKRSKATVKLHSGPNQMQIFEGTGPVDAVRQALKQVAQQLGSKQSVKIPVPASVRPHIIGKGGSTVQAIIQRTGARIQVPRPSEQATTPEDEEEDATIEVEIEGDAVAAEMARREIEAIVNERTSTVNTRMKDIPPEFFPFLAGPENSRAATLEEGRDLRVRIPDYHIWTHQAPPQEPQPNQRPVFVPNPHDYIQLSGDRNAVQEARENLERQVEELRQRITLQQLSIPRGQHQFIVGDRGDTLSDFLNATGCSVILPPAFDDTDFLTVVGPAEKIESGVEKVMDLAARMQSARVDLPNQPGNAPMATEIYARSLAQYLQERLAFEQLEQQHNSHIVLPTSEANPNTWEIYSANPRNMFQARTDLTNLINAHPQSRMMPLDIDPFYHQHLQERTLNRIQTDHGVYMVFPDEDAEVTQVLLVYEGQRDPETPYVCPRTKQRPTSPEIAQFKSALQQAQKDILNIISGRPSVTTKIVEVPDKFHDRLRRFVKKEEQNNGLGDIPVRIRYGPSKARRHSKAIPDNAVSLRGPVDDVEKLATKIETFVKEELQNEKERGFTLTFDFPQKFASYLIGRKGENINRYRDDYDVEIQLHDGTVEIKGPQKHAEAAKANIVALGKKLEDEVTHILKVKPQYHRDLIGAKGSQVNRLQDRYNVRVQFPRSTNGQGGDDQSVADAASEAGARPHRHNQAPDEVIVKGPKRGADEARDEILNLLQWTIDNSFTATVSVAQAQIPSLIGQGGREMDNLRMSTGAQIDVPGVRDGADSAGRVEIRIKGNKKQVEQAKKLLGDRAKIFDESVIRTIDVPKKYHKALIGGGGSNIRNLVLEAGGPDDRRELARIVRFPRPESDDTTIRVEGNKAIVEKIVNSIETFVNERENRATEILEIAPEKHRLLIGRGGETRRSIESQFHVSIDIPRQSVQGAARSHIKLEGPPEDIEKAKAHIMNIVQSQAGETIQIPRRFHHFIADNGQFFRRLRNDHHVTVDHAGQQPPARPATPDVRAQMNGGAMPLITDEAQDSDEQFGWQVVSLDENAEDGEIPWILSGSKENVAKAKSIVEKALEQAKQETATGYLLLPDPRTYRYVVGPGGSHINAIRKNTGCKIHVPRNQDKAEAIEIRGSPEGVESAKDMCLDAVKKGKSGNGNGFPRP
ncbi:MAG: hypothetical protein M1834_008518 [Cirrosporium novae-zelandiae]|nr:MAG: hypothetical protein M1834_008518 [Cirrosporium novae-zelandiae]